MPDDIANVTGRYIQDYIIYNSHFKHISFKLVLHKDIDFYVCPLSIAYIHVLSS